MLLRKQKEKLVDDVVRELKDAQAFIFVDFLGLKVAEMQELRKKIKAQKAVLKVLKKTLADIIMNKLNLPKKVKELDGSIAIIAMKEKNESAVAKQIYDFSKKTEFCKIMGGIVNNQFVPAVSMIELAQLPPYEALIGKFAGVIASPLYGLANVLTANLRGLAAVLKIVKDKK